MDPLYESAPARSGRCSVSPAVSLHYELRGSAAAPEKVLLIMGAFATCRHFEQLADSLAAAGGGARLEVLTYDHRGIGRSTAPAPAAAPPQTSELLAADALALVLCAWPEWPAGARLHVYGASMGGMVAQKLALLLPRGAAPPLCSLTLAVTARGYGMARCLPLGFRFYRAVLPLALPSAPAALVDVLLPQMFAPSYRNLPHSRDAAGATMGELWRRRWAAEFAEWFCLASLDATAAQAPVAGKHFLADAELAQLRDKGPPILVAIAGDDKVMKPAAQRALARALRARVHEMPGGHVGSAEDFKGLVRAVSDHIVDAADAAGAAAAEAAR